MKKSVLAIAAHPDDIEFVMAGTLLRLIEAGWDAHYFNIANGCCGSSKLDRDSCARVRLEESRNAAALMPASFYPPICNDLEIFYTGENHSRVAAVVRQAKPSIVLTHAPLDYMEDHQNACRLAVGGAFVRAMQNFGTIPEVAPYADDVAVYHAQPHGNRDPLRQLVEPEIFVDVSSLMDRKQQLLQCHASQGAWLDETQGMSSYAQSMHELNGELGKLSGCFEFAEGWRRHLHLGLAASPQFDPLVETLEDSLVAGRQG